MTQLELGLGRNKETDRNFHLGGRSFYFFDFDDNIAHLATPLVIFHKNTGAEKLLSSEDWALHHSAIGQPGPFQDYILDFNEQRGSFRYFRDQTQERLLELGYQRQVFVEDLWKALTATHWQWKGPSWDCFFHATFNQRPVSVITARGHHPETLKEGIRLLVKEKHLPMEPHYLSVFPVSQPDTRVLLGDKTLVATTAELKQKAIRASVEKAFEIYGYNPHHRFGMSDDDPKNIQLIYEEMARLKTDYPEVSFFMIETHQGKFVKHEVMHHSLKSSVLKNSVPKNSDTDSLAQMSFFENLQS